MRNLADQLRTTTFLLTLRYMVLFFVSVTILIGFISWSATGVLEEETDATITAEIAGLAQQYQQFGAQGLARVIAARLSTNPGGDAIYLITDSELKPLLGNLEAWPAMQQESDGWVSFQTTESEGDRVSVRARVFSPEPNLRLIIGRKVIALTKLTTLFDRTLIWGLSVSLLLALIGGLLMSNNVLRRVGQINDSSRRIMAGDLSERMPTTGTRDEFDELSQNLNVMMDQIEALMIGIQHMSDNVAHDLRTPLTRLRSRLEDLRHDAESADHDEIDACIEDADALLATFASLLSIARLESGSYDTNQESVDLGRTVRDAYELYKALADEAAISLSCDAPGTVEVIGDRNLLFQAITNLLDNAIKYSPPQSEVSISLETVSGHPVVSIADHGAGIPDDEKEKVSQRFYRLDKSRSKPGAGLGLSLVQAIAQRHNAVLELDDNHPGLIVRLRFPAESTTDQKRASV